MVEVCIQKYESLNFEKKTENTLTEAKRKL